MTPNFGENMRYKAVKENDGTYTIRASECGLNWEIIQSGVRGCNVDRVINYLYKKDMEEEFSQKIEKELPQRIKKDSREAMADELLEQFVLSSLEEADITGWNHDHNKLSCEVYCDSPYIAKGFVVTFDDSDKVVQVEFDGEIVTDTN